MTATDTEVVSHGPDDDWGKMLAAVREERDRLQRELEHVAAALLREAQQREWCDDYDHFCNRVNRDLGRAVLEPCPRVQMVELRVNLEWRQSSPVLPTQTMADMVEGCLREYLEYPDTAHDTAITVRVH